MLNANQYIDKDLFDKISSGDEEAFRQLFHTCNKSLFSFIASLVKSEADAKEIIQEIFLNLWINRLQLSRIENPGGWLHTIAANSAYSHLRKEARFAKRQFKAQSLLTESTPDIYGQMENREAQALISEAIQRLPVRRRQVFQLSRMEGFSRKEIAEQLNISENTVRNQLVDAVSFVQDYLRKKGFLHLIIFIMFRLLSK
ncbi:MAG: RNA polymerase sigma-70 factor [Flavitalea sp.]